MKQKLKTLICSIIIIAGFTEMGYGQSCSSPSSVTVGIPRLAQNQTSSKFWYKFTASSNNMFLDINPNDSTFYGIDSVILYNVNCASKTVIQSIAKLLTDSVSMLELHMTSLTENTEYLIMVSKTTYNTVNYDLYLLNSSATACNLVNNTDFDVPSPCPIATNTNPLSQITTGWSSNSTTPDYYNACNTSTISNGVNPNYSPNGLIPTSGGYIGLYCGQNALEYATGSLVPMVANKKYYVSMLYAKKPGVKYSMNHLGMALTNSYITNTNPNNIFTPTLPWQITNPGNSMLNNTTWDLMGSCYQATGGESFVTIGNPNSIASTSYSLSNPSGNNPNAYYLIDNVQSVPLDLNITSASTICIGSATTLTTSLKCPLPIGVITNTAGVITNSLFVLSLIHI